MFFLDTEGRQYSLPVGWTDAARADVFVTVAAGRCPFRVADLLALARPEAVADEVFTARPEFFDARDMVQVKHEMMRRVRAEGQPVTKAAAAFGFSRPGGRRGRRRRLAALVPAIEPGAPEVDVLEMSARQASPPQVGPGQVEEIIAAGLRRSLSRALSSRGAASSPA